MSPGCVPAVLLVALSPTHYDCSRTQVSWSRYCIAIFGSSPLQTSLISNARPHESQDKSVTKQRNTTCMRKYFSEKNELPQAGFEPTTLFSVHLHMYVCYIQCIYTTYIQVLNLLF